LAARGTWQRRKPGSFTREGGFEAIAAQRAEKAAENEAGNQCDGDQFPNGRVAVEEQPVANVQEQRKHPAYHEGFDDIYSNQEEAPEHSASEAFAKQREKGPRRQMKRQILRLGEGEHNAAGKPQWESEGFQHWLPRTSDFAFVKSRSGNH
jgi:hypothetical protein